MGHEDKARCRACGRRFSVRTGSGIAVAGIHCEDCGHLELFARSEGLPAEDASDPGCFGRCTRCQGRLMLAAGPRCPRCRSGDLEIEATALWD